MSTIEIFVQIECNRVWSNENTKLYIFDLEMMKISPFQKLSELSYCYSYQTVAILQQILLMIEPYLPKDKNGVLRVEERMRTFFDKIQFTTKTVFLIDIQIEMD